MQRLPVREIKTRLNELLANGQLRLNGNEITAIERFPGGLSCESYKITLRHPEHTSHVVLRIEPEFGLLEPYDIVREHRLTQALIGTAVAAPKPLHIEEDSALIGAPFAIVEFVEGDSYRNDDERLANEETARHVGYQFVSQLSEIHTAPVEPAAKALGVSLEKPSPALAEIDVSRQRLAQGSVSAHPIIERALDTLEQHAPACDRWVVLHGDYRLPNIKWHDGVISGVLDWELAGVGDPVSDVAFTQTVGAGPCAIKGDLARLYTDLTGTEIGASRLAYYRLFHLVRAAIIGLSAAGAIRRGGSDLRLLTVATQALMIEGAISMMESQFLDSLAKAS